jgi:hypothetical protein
LNPKQLTAKKMRLSIIESIYQNRIVKITIPKNRIEAEEFITKSLCESGAKDIDSVKENDGSYDVWGTFNDDYFRLNITFEE